MLYNSLKYAVSFRDGMLSAETGGPGEIRRAVKGPESISPCISEYFKELFTSVWCLHLFNIQPWVARGYKHVSALLIPWCGHVGVEPSQCLFVSYDHDIGLLIPWCGPQHVGVEPSQCLSVSYEHDLGLLIPWCGPQHVGVEPSQCLFVSYEHDTSLLIPWCGPQHVG